MDVGWCAFEDTAPGAELKSGRHHRAAISRQGSPRKCRATTVAPPLRASCMMNDIDNASRKPG